MLSSVLPVITPRRINNHSLVPTYPRPPPFIKKYIYANQQHQSPVHFHALIDFVAIVTERKTHARFREAKQQTPDFISIEAGNKNETEIPVIYIYI